MRVDIHPMNENPSKKSSTQILSSPCESSSKPWNKWKSLSMNHEMNITSKQSFCNQVRLKEVVYRLKSASQSKVYGATGGYKIVSDEVANSNSTILRNSNSPPPTDRKLIVVISTLSIELRSQIISPPIKTCCARVSRPPVSQKRRSSLATLHIACLMLEVNVPNERNGFIVSKMSPPSSSSWPLANTINSYWKTRL